MDIPKLQRVIIDALEDVKAEDIRVFDTTKISDLFDRVIIATGNSNRQTKSLAMSVKESVKEKGGDVISVEDAVDIKTEIELDFKKSPFYKSEITENQGCLVNIGLQIKAAKFSSITPLKLTFEKPIVCKKNDIAVILKPESTTIRILGSGKIL